jgi:hypothetical protein
MQLKRTAPRKAYSFALLIANAMDLGRSPSRLRFPQKSAHLRMNEESVAFARDEEQHANMLLIKAATPFAAGLSFFDQDPSLMGSLEGQKVSLSIMPEIQRKSSRH